MHTHTCLGEFVITRLDLSTEDNAAIRRSEKELGNSLKQTTGSQGNVRLAPPRGRRAYLPVIQGPLPFPAVREGPAAVEALAVPLLHAFF